VDQHNKGVQRIAQDGAHHATVISPLSSFEVACHSLYGIANERRLEHQRVVVGVCGLGGSGKSTICRQVAMSASFPCTVFELDWYLTHSSQDRRDAILRSLAGVEANLDFWRDPTNWYDWELFEDDLKQIRNTGYLKRSGLWRQSTGAKDLEIIIELPNSGVVLCEGIYLAHPAARPFFDKFVFLEAPSHAALERSARRDSHRNPEGYQAFKTSVTISFDLPYFVKNRAACDTLVLT
jgi:uridine kinase